MAACGAGAEQKDAEKPKPLPFKPDELKKKSEALKDVTTVDSVADAVSMVRASISSGNAAKDLKKVPDDKKQHKDAPKTNEADYVKAPAEAEKK